MVMESIGLALTAFGGLYLAVDFLRPNVQARIARVSEVGRQLRSNPLGILAEERALAAAILLGIVGGILVGAEGQVQSLREQGFGFAASWFIPVVFITVGVVVLAVPALLLLWEERRGATKVLLLVIGIPGFVVLGLYSFFGFLLFAVVGYLVAAAAMLASSSSHLLGFERSMGATGAFLVAAGSILQLVAKL